MKRWELEEIMSKRRRKRVWEVGWGSSIQWRNKFVNLLFPQSHIIALCKPSLPLTRLKGDRTGWHQERRHFFFHFLCVCLCGRCEGGGQKKKSDLNLGAGRVIVPQWPSPETSISRSPTKCLFLSFPARSHLHTLASTKCVCPAPVSFFCFFSLFCWRCWSYFCVFVLLPLSSLSLSFEWCNVFCVFASTHNIAFIQHPCSYIRTWHLCAPSFPFSFQKKTKQ